MNHGGLKNVAPEQARVENKRERRRGAAGRAAALRRAPSDSDCSGETASLSADSGDRAPRPPPQPQRSGKTRSRRRGSEWEVLEGLKDGQRFEKRPDVFNGYLHKKRKWPLKGWHKRFFVVDGGILVYARSPSDVSRGRLHGSVDVGLSVISAKARRRRIDIDADEFIYHLRAKTPEVFRTWLNVLKAHRLYRQHLLTFGARESAPKIHAPLDDLAPTDTSSRTTYSLTSSSSSCDCRNMDPVLKLSNENNCSVQEIHMAADKNSFFDHYSSDTKTLEDNMNRQKSPISLSSTEAEKQVLSTDLEHNSLKTNDVDISSDINHCSSSSIGVHYEYKIPEKRGLFFNKRIELTQAYYCFSRNSRSPSPMITVIRKSNKSTNLTKYKNVAIEPKLKEPFRCMLLGDSNFRVDKRLDNHRRHGKLANNINRMNGVIKPSSNTIKKKKMVDANTDSDSKNVSEKIIKSIYQKNKDIEIANPVKEMFGCLMEYWLNNASKKHTITVMTQSDMLNEKNVNTSAIKIQKHNKETQLGGTNNHFIENTNKTHDSRSDINVHPIFVNRKFNKQKDRRIQELERLIKNTVYIVETTKSKEEDISITKTLIDNLEKLSQQFAKTDEMVRDNINSSIVKIQETIKNLVSDSLVSVDVTQELLSAYLSVFVHDDIKLPNNGSRSSGLLSSVLGDKFEVQTEAIVKRVSKSTSNMKTDHISSIKIDPGRRELYLKSLINKITGMFSRNKNLKNKIFKKNKSQNDIPAADDKINDVDKLGILVKNSANEKSIIIKLSKHDLDGISLRRNSSNKGDLLSINIKLKEKSHIKEFDRDKKNLPFSNTKPLVEFANNDNCLSFIHLKKSKSDELFSKNGPKRQGRSSDFNKDFDLKPYLSNSDVSKVSSLMNGTESSFGLSFNSSKALKKEYNNINEVQSCHHVTTNGSKFQSNRTLNQICDSLISRPKFEIHIKSSNQSQFLEKNAPRIIDEKFILLLLENLALLSKNVPNLCDEIAGFYLDLKKKYEEELRKHAEIENLIPLYSLYNQEYKTQSTQWETEISLDKNENIDRSIYTVFESQIPDHLRADSEILPRNFKSQNAQTDIAINELQTTKEIVNYEISKTSDSPGESPVSSLIKSVLGADLPPNIFYNNEKANDEAIFNERCSTAGQKYDYDDMHFLPLLKFYAQSNLNRKSVKFLKNDFNVHNLFVRKIYAGSLSSTLSDCKLDTLCNDVTLYQRNSDPSFCG